MKKDIVVIYHKNCADGFSGAWVAWKKFKNKADYIPLNIHNQKIEIENKKKIYFIDFTPEKNVLKKVCKNNEKIIIIDHHESVKNTLNEIEEINEKIFNKNNSASVLAWKYFFSNKKLPKLLEYVEDVDLWKMKLKNIEEIVAIIDFTKHEFKEWNKLAKNLELKEERGNLIKKGKELLKFKNDILNKIIKKRYFVKMDGHKIITINFPMFKSEIGHHLLKEKESKISMIWHESNNGVAVSLRSNNGIDVSKIAQKHGGGGHKNAAGFHLDSNTKKPWNKL
jgi:nanoRNase/pAp phosphatase (c-di-AMP/oligoRNAs hydrolase)